MNLLIADDDEIIRQFLGDVLEQEGHHIEAVSNGVEALDVLLRENAPNLVVLDWKMPEMDGIGVIEAVRKHRDHGDLYIIVVTGISDRDTVITAIEAGADDFVNKPCRSQELLARVRSGARILALHDEKIQMLHQLQHAQKLESIGQLAAGIAHEINTPVQYIGDNTRFIKESLDDIIEIIESTKAIIEVARAGKLDEASLTAFERTIEEADLDFLSEQIPLAVSQSLDGLQRVSDIVRAMKEFAHPGSGEPAPTDINHIVTSIATVTRNEWKYVADLDVVLDEHLPLVPCLAGDLSQAFINLVVNGAHAIQERREKRGEQTKGHINIETRLNDALNAVEIAISDTGTGIPSAVQGRIFDPFFTTKEVGKGTGQGLAIAYTVVVDKHDGEIFFNTEEGRGTTFTIRLPLSRDSRTGMISRV